MNIMFIFYADSVFFLSYIYPRFHFDMFYVHFAPTETQTYLIKLCWTGYEKYCSRTKDELCRSSRLRSFSVQAHSLCSCFFESWILMLSSHCIYILYSDSKKIEVFCGAIMCCCHPYTRGKSIQTNVSFTSNALNSNNLLKKECNAQNVKNCHNNQSNATNSLPSKCQNWTHISSDLALLHIIWALLVWCILRVHCGHW